MPNQYFPQTWGAFLSEYGQVSQTKKKQVEKELGILDLKNVLGTGWDDEAETASDANSSEIKWNEEIADLNDFAILHADIKFQQLFDNTYQLNKIYKNEPAIKSLCLAVLALARELLSDLEKANNNTQLEDEVKRIVNESLEKIQSFSLHKHNLKNIYNLRNTYNLKNTSNFEENAKVTNYLDLKDLFDMLSSLNERILGNPKIAEVYRVTFDLTTALINDIPILSKNAKEKLEKITEINKIAENTVNYLDRIILTPLNTNTPMSKQDAKTLTKTYIAANTKLTLKKTIKDIVSALGTIALGFCCGLIIGGGIGLATGVVHAPLIALSAGIVGATLATSYQAHKLAGPFGLFPKESPALPKIKELGKNAENFADKCLTLYKL